MQVKIKSYSVCIALDLRYGASPSVTIVTCHQTRAPS